MSSRRRSSRPRTARTRSTRPPTARPSPTQAAVDRLLALPANAHLLEAWARGAMRRRAAFDAAATSATLTQIHDLLLQHTRVNPAQALAAVDHVRAAVNRRMDAADRARWVRMHAHALRSVGRAEEARAAYAAAYSAFTRLKLTVELVPTAIGWVDALALCGRPLEAAGVAKAARRHLRWADALAPARLQVNLGNALFWAGRLTQAEEHYRAAQRRFLAAKRPWEAAFCAFNRANALLAVGRPGPARRLLGPAEAALAAEGSRALQLQVRISLAECDLMEGDWDRGLGDLQRARGELQRLGDQRACAAADRELAALFAALGAVEVAEPLAGAALQSYRALGLRTEAAHAGFLHARLLLLQGRDHDAQVRLEQALSHWRETGNTWALRVTELEVARALLRRGNPARALRLLRRAQRALEVRDPRSGGARCRALTAQALMAARRPTAAAAAARAAYDGARDYPARLERPWLALLFAQAQLEAKQGAVAVQWAKRAVRELDSQLARFGSRTLRGNLAGSRERLYRDAVDVVLRHGGSGAARTALELITAARSAQLVEDLLHRDARLLREDVRAALARLRDELLGTRDPGVDDVRSRALRGEMEQLSRELHQAPPLRARAARRAMAARRIQQWAPQLRRRDLVLFDRTGGGWRAFVVEGVDAPPNDSGAGSRRTPGRGAVQWNTHVAAIELPHAEAALRECWIPTRLLLEAAAAAPRARRRLLLERTAEEAAVALARLREALWRPLGLSADRDVVVVPTGPLHGVPLEALALDPAAPIAGSPLPVVARLPHPSLLASTGRPDRDRALLLHGPEEGARREVQTVEQVLRAAALRTRIGTRRTDLSSQSDPLALLHVAAHGAYHREQALLSGIQLADGWVGFEQLDRKVVEGALLYFGSCESGSTREGPGAELDGWMAAGLGAGARELVLTLWKLDDEAAEAFAAEFYPLWTAGMPAPRAAGLARLAVRERLPHPFSWAPFVALG